jgi:prepilin-type N-terminal cleavage/methylation domain-containing protein/prepilin-type processing-associated H-X9-DG protein
MRSRHAFSLVELLVVVAIIGVLAALLVPALSRARSKAEQVAAVEAMRQKHIGELAKDANAPWPDDFERPDREECREAYARILETGSGETLVTELLYKVRNEAEFKAYWHTMINPYAEEELEFGGSKLIALDEEGREFELLPLELHMLKEKAFPIAWEFLSTNMAEMSSGSIGANVMYSDGHVKYISYPGAYPVCKTVAELSHRFVQEMGWDEEVEEEEEEEEA